MPNAIITAIMFVGNLVMTALPVIEVVFGIGGATMFVTGALAITAGVVGMSKLMEMSIPRPDSNYARQKTVRSTTAPVKRVYGESLISGPVAFIGVGGTGNQDLWHVIALTGDKSEAITDIYLDNIIIPNADINSGNALGGAVNGTTTIFKPIDSTTLVTVYKYTGGQTAVSQPVANEFFKWTSDHEGQGLTYIATKFSFPDNEKIAEIWNKYNPQDIKALVKGMAIYDPRKDSTSPEYDSSLGVSTHRLSDSTTWQWSDNPALCLANYVIDDQFGMGVPSSAIDWASVHSSADYSDALVSIPNSQTQKRFTCNGVLYGTDSHSQNINKILSSMNGSLVYSSGKYVMQAGQYIEPESDAILTDNDLNGPINITVANARDDRFNTIKGTHFNPEDLHKKVAFPEVQLTDISTRDAGEVLYKEVELPMTNDVYMCQRLTYQMINRSNDQLLIEFPCNLKALRYTVGDRVKITLDKFAGSDQDSISFNQTPFVILGFNFSAEGAVTLTMLKDTQANYTDMPAGNYSQIASDGSITDGFSGVPAPTNLSSVVIGHDVRLTWDNPVPNTTFNDIIVYQSTTSNFSDSSILLRTKNDAITFVLPSSALTRYYWVRASLYDNEVAATDIIIGQTYRIRSLGTTSWTTLGATAPVSNGDTFLATASGTSSSGTGIATDESAVSAVVGPETVTTTDQVADSVEWIDVDDSNSLRPANNATVGATLGTDVYDGQAQAYAVGDLLNSNGFFRFTRTSADDNVDAPANAAAFNTAFGRNPTDGDIVVVTNTTSSPNKQAAYQYDGSTFGTISGFFAGDLIIDDTITAAAISVDDLGAINANLGTITGGTLKGGTVPDADAAPSGTESGSFFDLTDGKFVVGNATNNILFDSSALTVTGTVNASAGAFTGDVSTDAKFIAGSNSSTVTLDGNATANYSIFAGAEQATDASFKVASDGVVEATRLIIRDDANGQVLIDTSNTANPFSGVVYTSISQGSGAGVDTVAGTLADNAGEITITTTQAETFLITAKVAIDDNDGSTNNISGASTVSTTDAENQLKGADLKIEYYLKEGAGAYALEDTEIVTFTEGTPSPSQIKVFGVDRGAGYSGSLTRYFAVIQGGGAAEFVTYFSTSSNANRARTYAVTTASISISGAGTHKIKILARLVDAGTNTTLTNSTTPALVNNNATGTYGGSGIVLDAAQSPPNQSSLDNFKRIYEATSANGFVVSAANTFAIGEGTTILTSGGTISGDLVITGDLTVQGTTTTINVADLTVADKDITLNYSTGDSSATANNAGIIIQDAVNSTTDASILWKTASDSFEFSHPVNPLTVNSSLNLRSAGGEAGIYLQDSSASNATAFKIYADVTLATSTLYIDYDPSVAGNNWAFVNNGNFLASGTIFADGAASNSLQWEAGYDYSQVGHLPLAGGTVSAQTFFLADVAWKVSGSDAAHQRADARDDATSFSRLHWYGVADNGATSNFRHAWYDGAAYINVTAASGTATFGGNIAATDATFTGDVETKIIDQYQEFSAGNGDHEVHYFSKVLATYSENSSSQTYIILTTSVPQSAFSMGGFQLTFWDRYNDADSGDVVDIYGYWNPESNDGFQGFRYNSKNPNFEPTIQVGVDSSGYTVFILSNFGTSSYAQLVAKDFWSGYTSTGAARSWGQGWSFSTSNSISAYSNLDTLARNGVTSAQITNLSTAYNYSQVGHLPLAGGTLTGTLAMGANAITSTGTISSGAITSTGDVSADDGRVRIGNPTTLSGRSSIRIDANGDSFADLVFGDNTSATGWNDANWSISSRSSSENNSLRIYRGAGQPSPYNSEHVLMEFKQNNLVSVNSTLQINNTTIIDSSRNLTNIGTISSGAITSISAIGAADDVRTGLIHYDSTAMAAGVGGQLILGYNYLSTGGYTAGAILKTYKENATSNHYGSGLKFQVRNTGYGLSTKMTLNPSGNLSVTGGIQSFGPKNQTEYPGGILNITDTTAVAAGVGGGLLFQGKYSGSTITTSGSIDTRKDNGTAGSFGFSMVFNTRVNGGQNTTALTLGSNQSATFAGTVTATQDAYVDNHLHVGKSGGWLQFYDDQGVGSTVSKGNLYFDATTKEFRFYSAVLSTGAAESTATLKRYNGSAYESIYDTGSGVPWADINAGVRTNFTIGFKPATNNYAGLLFQDQNAGNAGYLLVRGNSDVAPTYKANGITLVADAGYLSLVSRTTSNTGVRILSGTTPAERMVFKSDGTIDNPSAKWARTYHQTHSYDSSAAQNTVHTHWGVLCAGSDSGTPEAYTIIETNINQDAYRMGGFTILVMNAYGDHTQRERIDLAGYWNPESNGGFQGWGYTTTNPSERPNIQVMRNTATGKVAFAYQHTGGGSAGSYPVIVACDLWTGYANSAEDDGKNWTIKQAANLNAYTNSDQVNYVSGNGNYQATDGRLVISKSAGTMLSHGAFSDAIGYNASYGTYVGAGGRYVYSGTTSSGNGGSHPYYSNGSGVHNILHNGGQIASTYNGDHTFTTTTTSAGIKVTNNQSGGPALKIHNTSTSGTDWWLISNGTANTNGVGLLQLWANNYSFTSATFGNTATSITNFNTQTRIQTTAQPPLFTSTTTGDLRPAILANSNGFDAHALVVNQTQTSHWAQVISTQGYGLFIDNHTSGSGNDLFRTAVGGTTQFYIRGDGVTFCKQAFHIGDSSVFGTLQLKANSSSGGTIDAYAPNGSFVHSDVRNNGTWSMAHKYTYKNGNGYGNYTENWWDGSSYHQLGSISNAIRTNGDFVASGNITAYGTYSDRRLKENIRPFENARELIKDIDVHRFNYIGKDDDLIGVIAQEVEETLPQLVYELIDTDSDEVRKAVRYDHLSAVLLKAVKEQDEEIKELKEMVKKLMEKIQ